MLEMLLGYPPPVATHLFAPRVDTDYQLSSIASRDHSGRGRINLGIYSEHATLLNSDMVAHNYNYSIESSILKHVQSIVVSHPHGSNVSLRAQMYRQRSHNSLLARFYRIILQ